MHYRTAILGLLAAAASLNAQQAKRAMTFLDVQGMRQASAPVISADGAWGLFTLTTPDWKANRRQSDIYLVNVKAGAGSARQLTYTNDKNETSPLWAPDGGFVFSSNRDAPSGAAPAGGVPSGGPPGRASGGGEGSQLYYMRPDGGEARKITNATGGVGQFQFTRDSKWLVYSAGRANQQQLWAIPATAIDGLAVQLTRHPTPVRQWMLSHDGATVFFLSPDTVFTDERRRIESNFGVTIRNQVEPRVHLWKLDLATKTTKRLTGDTAYSVTSVTLSDDGKWAGFNATRDDRYFRGTTDERNASDLYLLEIATGKIERLTNNTDIGESSLSFSPDGRTIAFAAEDDFKMMRNRKLYLRPVEGGTWRKLGASFDGDVSVGWWSDDGKTIYFNEGWRATNQLFAVDVASGAVRPLTNLRASLQATKQEQSNTLLINYSDPQTPPSAYTVASVDKIGDKSAWVRLTNPNPQVAGFALGEAEETCWKSTDAAQACGVLLKPVGFQMGTKYPLIVAIHGGPASADVLGFNGGYGSQIYAGAGYAVLMPNYRNSTNYGEKFKIESQGDYFTKGYNDIMTGVDQLIKDGLVDGNQMGALGWSAGGHWSNWILTHTNRFKAISTGAGTMNWLSMYAQSDVQRVRQWYMGDKLPYDDFDRWFAQSPMKYIKNAKTPTMIHVVSGDPRVPRPQSEELHMALKKLGVPTEFFVYPGNSHGIPAARDQYTKAMAEFRWMEKWVRGKNVSFAWKDLLATVTDSTTAGRR